MLFLNIRVLGTAGQNVYDIYKVSSFEDRLEILEHTMNWSHIAPTAPDTLGEMSLDPPPPVDTLGILC